MDRLNDHLPSWLKFAFPPMYRAFSIDDFERGRKDISFPFLHYISPVSMVTLYMPMIEFVNIDVERQEPDKYHDVKLVDFNNSLFVHALNGFEGTGLEAGDRKRFNEVTCFYNCSQDVLYFFNAKGDTPVKKRVKIKRAPSSLLGLLPASS